VVANRTWQALVDTGFNSDLELPEALRASVPGNEITIGTRLLRKHRLEIHFVNGTVLIERVGDR
jgi:hypothetical protein